jgi:hypothetical protein
LSDAVPGEKINELGSAYESQWLSGGELLRATGPPKGNNTISKKRGFRNLPYGDPWEAGEDTWLLSN